MDVEKRDEWTRRLRSGYYKQGRGALKRMARSNNGRFTGVKHCCLAVLCEMAKEDGVVIEERQHLGFYSFDGSTSTLPRKVAEWAGISKPFRGSFSTVVPLTLESGQKTCLTDLNDIDGVSFEEIADIIERYL